MAGQPGTRSSPGLGIVAPRRALADQFLEFQQPQVCAVEDQAQAQAEAGKHHEGRRQHGAGDCIHVAHGGVFIDRARAGGQAEQEEHDAGEPEKGEWLVGPQDQEELEHDGESVGEGA